MGRGARRFKAAGADPMRGSYVRTGGADRAAMDSRASRA